MKIFLILCVVPWLLAAQTVEEGNAEFQGGHISRAKEIFEAVIKKDDKNAEAHYRLGLIELRRSFRDEDEAVDHMERAVELKPDNANYQYGYGAALGTKAQHAGVIKQAFLAPKVKKAFLRAVELDPKLVEARIGLAQYYLQAPSIMGGDEEMGWKEIDTVIAQDEYRGRVTKAGILARDKKVEQAEQQLDILSSKYPGDWRVWNSICGFYLRQKKVTEALSASQKCVTLRPDTALSYRNLGQAQLQKGEYDAALGSLQKALNMDKDDLVATYYLAKTYEAKGMKKEARESYQRVLELDPWEGLRKEVEKNLKDLST